MCREWSDMSTCELLIQCYKNQTKHVGLVQSEHSHRLIEMQLVLAYLTLNSTIHDEHKYTSKTVSNASL